jgi:PhnB protein
MDLNAYLTFNGQCEQAFQFYERALGGKIQFSHPYANSPMEEQCAPEWRNKMMHMRMTIRGNVLMGSDCMPGQFEGDYKGMALSLGIPDPDEAERIFKNLSENARVITMPIQPTFWAKKFGMLTDQFGVPWMVNCEQPA